MKTNFVKAVIVLAICGTSALANNNLLPAGNGTQTTNGTLAPTEATTTNPFQITYYDKVNWNDNNAMGIAFAEITTAAANANCTNEDVFTARILFIDDATAEIRLYDADANLSEVMQVGLSDDGEVARKKVAHLDPKLQAAQTGLANEIDRKTISHFDPKLQNVKAGLPNEIDRKTIAPIDPKLHNVKSILPAEAEQKRIADLDSKLFADDNAQLVSVARLAGVDNRTICLKRNINIVLNVQRIADRTCKDMPAIIRCPDLDVIITLVMHSRCSMQKNSFIRTSYTD